MENSNSREYLEKITAAVIDNLRNTGPAPSVQMQDVPRKPFGGMTDEEEAELDDLDEDENKDVRMSEHRWDKNVENAAEFEGSDDEEMASANGKTRSAGKRSFNDFSKGDGETDGKATSPKANGDDTEQAADDAHDVNDDTLEDVTAAAEADKEGEAEDAEKTGESSKLDNDGDVGMTDSAAGEEEEAKIKQEEVEQDAAPEPAAEGDKPAEEETAAETETAPEAEAEASKPEAEAAEAKTEETDDKPAEEDKQEAAEAKDKEADTSDAMVVDEKEKPAETAEST